jgi:hypothetical protein
METCRETILVKSIVGPGARERAMPTALYRTGIELHEAALGGGGSSAPLAGSMLAVPSARAGAVPSFVGINARGPTDFPRIGVDVHSRAPPLVNAYQRPIHVPRLRVGVHNRLPPRLCTPTHEGSTSLLSVSPSLAPPLVRTCQRARGVDFSLIRVGVCSCHPVPSFVQANTQRIEF